MCKYNYRSSKNDILRLLLLLLLLYITHKKLYRCVNILKNLLMSEIYFFYCLKYRGYYIYSIFRYSIFRYHRQKASQTFLALFVQAGLTARLCLMQYRGSDGASREYSGRISGLAARQR